MATREHEKYYNYIQFVTTNIYNRVRIFLTPKYCQILLDNLDFYRKKYRFKLQGYVIMPDHCHLLILLDNERGNISQIMHDWKSYTSQVIIKDLRQAEQGAPLSRKMVLAGQGALPSKSCEFPSPIVTQAPCLGNNRTLIQSGRLWQERFDSFSIYSDKKFEEKLNYIHNNPARAGLVKNLDDYPWSSYQNYYLNNHSLIKIDY